MTARSRFALVVAALGAAVPAGLADEAETAAARKDFAVYCSSCHGAGGAGDGPVAMELKTPPADLTRIAQRAGGTYPTAEVYRRIEGLDEPTAHGTRDMPVWGMWFTFQAVGEGVLLDDAKTAEAEARRRIERMVEYIATLQVE